MKLIERIDAARERWNVLEHPFYTRWSCGELTRDELAHYAGEYRHAVVALADTAEEDRPRGARARGGRARRALGRVRRRLRRRDGSRAGAPRRPSAWSPGRLRRTGARRSRSCTRSRPASRRSHRRSSTGWASTTASRRRAGRRVLRTALRARPRARRRVAPRARARPRRGRRPPGRGCRSGAQG